MTGRSQVTGLDSIPAGKPVLLDAFCGEGGAGAGYDRAGFHVIGIDTAPMPRYPFPFIRADALELISRLTRTGEIRKVAALHGSPPCHRYSTLSKVYRTDRLDTYPDLIGPAREVFAATGLPFVIENVRGAPLAGPVTLCGSHFGLTSVWPGVGLPGAEGGTVKVGLRRHRLFEAHGFRLPDPGPHDHSYRVVPVYGYTNNFIFRGRGFSGESFNDLRRQMMEISWMGHEALNEAIPPAYAAYVGSYLMDAVTGRDGSAVNRWLAGREPWGIAVCAWCDRGFQVRRASGRFCSGACRQAAYRDRQSRQRAPREAAAAPEPVTLRQCARCGEWFRPLRATGLWCSGACRQAAYRGRAALR